MNNPTKNQPVAQPGTKASLQNERPFQLSWMDDDIENRLGFRGGRYTSVNKVLSVLLAIFFLFIFGLAVFGMTFIPTMKPVSDVFLRTGNIWTIGPAIFLFFFSIAMLLFKWRKLAFQRRALNLSTVPQNPDFILNERTAKTALKRLQGLVDNPRHFILLNRVQTALASLHNIGAISEVASILKNQGDNDDNQIASSYTLVSGAVWAIPVLGFIGTVMGLSSAIGKFANTLQLSTEIEAIKANLTEVTGGLSTAFETTLIALICALIIQLILNYLQQLESEFLDECNDYCHTYVISKLRLADHGRMPSRADFPKAAGETKSKAPPPQTPTGKDSKADGTTPDTGAAPLPKVPLTNGPEPSTPEKKES
jgi:biopolymer transport protein ExbB/TolQ